ncbi:MAG: DUF424 family protein [Candidatus Bathyarchaeota archaeon]|nr:DUF424 family protein [Candidatus Bathyarchaeota archaeon]
MSEVYLRTSRHGRDTLVAVCDAELLGQTILGGRVPFTVSEEFYKGVPGSVEEAVAAMRRATICNLVGKRIVEAAVEKRLVHQKAVIYFGDVPHAQIVKM